MRDPSASLTVATAGLVLLASLALSACEPARTPPPPLPTYGPSHPLPQASCQQEQIDLPAPVPLQKELVLSEPSKQGLLRYARALCNGDTAGAKGVTLPAELQSVQAPLILVYYDADGTRRTQRRVDGEQTLADKVAQAVPQVCRGTPDGFLHLLVVSYTGRMPNFGVQGLFDNKVFEPQVTGLVLERRGRRAEVDPLEMLERNLGRTGARDFAGRRLGIQPKSFSTYNDLWIEIYRAIHFGEAYPSRQFTNFHRGHRVFTVDDLDRPELARRLALIGEWYRHNVKGGQVTYEYAPAEQETRDAKRTMVRSTMSTWILNRLAFYLNDDELKRLGDQCIDYYLQRYFQIRESLQAGSIQPSEQALPNGNLARNRYTTASFIASAILERADHARREREMAMLMEWAMGFVRDDGLMWTQFAQSQYFMPGQLLLAVAYFYEATRDEKYRTFFDRVFSAYETPLYASMHLGQGRWIPYAPAWFTQPLAKMYEVTKERRYRDMVYAINDRVAKLYEHNARHQVYYDYDGVLNPKLGFYGNNSVTAAGLESLADAALVAQLDGDARRLAAYTTVVRHTTAFLLRLQYLPENTYYIRDRPRVVGGFKRDMVNTVSWMDNVWHLTSAFIKIQERGLLPERAPNRGPATPPAAP